MPDACKQQERPAFATVAIVAVATVLFGGALAFRDLANVWVATGLVSVAVLVMGWPFLRDVVADPNTWRVALWLQGAALGLLMAAATWLLYPPLSSLMPPVGAEVDALYLHLHDPPGPLAALPIVALVVVAEEVIWRGIAYRALARRHSGWKLVAMGTLLYALPQLGSGSWMLVALALACGTAWTSVRWRSNSLASAIATHLTWDACVFVLLPVTDLDSSRLLG